MTLRDIILPPVVASYRWPATIQEWSGPSGSDVAILSYHLLPLVTDH